MLKRCFDLTNINCSEKCIYQKDGKCCFENIGTQSSISNTDCIYFVPIKHSSENNSGLY